MNISEITLIEYLYLSNISTTTKVAVRYFDIKEYKHNKELIDEYKLNMQLRIKN